MQSVQDAEVVRVKIRTGEYDSGPRGGVAA